VKCTGPSGQPLHALAAPRRKPTASTAPAQPRATLSPSARTSAK
jgi:hypothetical protein